MAVQEGVRVRENDVGDDDDADDDDEKEEEEEEEVEEENNKGGGEGEGEGEEFDDLTFFLNLYSSSSSTLSSPSAISVVCMTARWLLSDQNTSQVIHLSNGLICRDEMGM